MWHALLVFVTFGSLASAYVDIDGIVQPAHDMRDAFRSVMQATEEHMENAKYFTFFQQTLEKSMKDDPNIKNSPAAKASLGAVIDAVSKTLLRINADDVDAYQKALGEMVKNADKISAQLPAFKTQALCSLLPRDFQVEIDAFLKQLVDNQIDTLPDVIERFDELLKKRIALPTISAYFGTMIRAMRVEIQSTLNTIEWLKGPAVKTAALELGEKIKALNPCDKN